MADFFDTDSKAADAPRAGTQASIPHGNWKKQLSDLLKQQENLSLIHI